MRRDHLVLVGFFNFPLPVKWFADYIAQNKLFEFLGKFSLASLFA
jgi:hypothetical protein